PPWDANALGKHRQSATMAITLVNAHAMLDDLSRSPFSVMEVDNTGIKNNKGQLHSAGLFTRGTKLRNYFLGAMASFFALATRNFTTVLAGILIGSPV